MSDWFADAACLGKGELFFAPSTVGRVGRTVDFDFGPALAICRTECPVLAQCRAWAIEAGDIDRKGRAVHGVIAGLVPPSKAGGPTMKRCQLESCQELFMGSAVERYCSPACSREAHRLQHRASRKRAS